MKLALTLLRDTTQVPNWANIAWYVGESGSPEYFEPLKEFVLGGHAPIDPGKWFGAITSAQLGIGTIAASSPQALRYLSQSTNPTFWKTFPQDVRLAMSETSIEALGNSGASEARQILLRLRQWPYRESQRDAIEKATGNLEEERWNGSTTGGPADSIRITICWRSSLPEPIAYPFLEAGDGFVP